MPERPTLEYARRKPMPWWLVVLFAIAVSVHLIALVLPWVQSYRKPLAPAVLPNSNQFEIDLLVDGITIAPTSHPTTAPTTTQPSAVEWHDFEIHERIPETQP
jgi:hypothetical protein